jgi:iron complex outermembrane recepter protein
MQFSSFTVFLILIFFQTGALWAKPANEHISGTSRSTGVVYGIIVDAENGEPVMLASVMLTGHDRGTISHEGGWFEMRNVPTGRQTLRVQHIGYETRHYSLDVRQGDTTHVEIAIRPSVFRGDGIEVIGGYLRDDETTTVERVISGRRLRQQLGRTIAETLEDEPGLAQRSMGPAPARPVLRGLGGERLLILEDGGRTGDLSATASDHALAIEPMTAEHIELIRGPSALVHGSNTMGGVINVIRGQIPLDHPDHIHFSGSFQGETVNNGLSGGFRTFGPVGPRLAFRADASIRSAGDIQTPEGQLDNSGIITRNGSFGLSYIRPWGMAGISGNILDSHYGVPGGEGIAEMHPNGVDIEMYRRYLESRIRVNLGEGWLRRLDLSSTYSYYYHEELEKRHDPDEPQPVGASFGVLTTNVRLNLHHNGYSFVEKGLFGIWGEHRDYASGGLTHTPETIERSLAGYIFQETNPGSWSFQAAARLDVKQLDPGPARPSLIIGDDIRERIYTGYSGSFSGSYYFGSGVKSGMILMKAYRAPGIEELFSEGPHLANYSYEIGNPNLNAESGLGLEWFFRITRNRMQLNTALFRNRMSNYIFPQDQGRPSLKRDDLPEYQYTGKRVLMTGAEFEFEYRISGLWKSTGTVSFVRGDFIDEDRRFPFIETGNAADAVPMMPPLSSRFDLEYGQSNYRIGGVTRMARRQNRTDQFEEPTEGYMVFDIYAQYHANRWGMLHTFSFNVQNIADTHYENHLSRIKSIMPEQGRSFKILYRFYF